MAKLGPKIVKISLAAEVAQTPLGELTLLTGRSLGDGLSSWTTSPRVRVFSRNRSSIPLNCEENKSFVSLSIRKVYVLYYIMLMSWENTEWLLMQLLCRRKPFSTRQNQTNSPTMTTPRTAWAHGRKKHDLCDTLLPSSDQPRIVLRCLEIVMFRSRFLDTRSTDLEEDNSCEKRYSSDSFSIWIFFFLLCTLSELLGPWFWKRYPCVTSYELLCVDFNENCMTCQHQNLAQGSFRKSLHFDLKLHHQLLPFGRKSRLNYSIEASSLVTRGLPFRTARQMEGFLVYEVCISDLETYALTCPPTFGKLSFQVQLVLGTTINCPHRVIFLPLWR